MCILFGVTLAEHFGTCRRTNRLQNHTELQGKEAVPSDGSPSVMQASQLFPLAFSPKICLGFFVCLLLTGKVMECCWVWGLLQNQIQLLFNFKGFIINLQLNSLARGREGKHSFFSATGFRELTCAHYSCILIFWDQEQIMVQHMETLRCLCSCDQSCKALSPLLWSCWLQFPTWFAAGGPRTVLLP